MYSESFAISLEKTLSKYTYSKFLMTSIELENTKHRLEDVFNESNCEFLNVIPLESRENPCIHIIKWIGQYEQQLDELKKLSNRDRIQSKLTIINNFDNMINKYLSEIKVSSYKSVKCEISSYIFDYSVMRDISKLIPLLKKRFRK